eukprot:1257345-Lingulodinium_polyedra.AAC.1
MESKAPLPFAGAGVHMCFAPALGDDDDSFVRHWCRRRVRGIIFSSPGQNMTSQGYSPCFHVSNQSEWREAHRR